jgi:hypothetical protein
MYTERPKLAAIIYREDAKTCVVYARLIGEVVDFLATDHWYVTCLEAIAQPSARRS